MKYHYVKDGVVLASTPNTILSEIAKDFKTRFSRDFFRLPAAEKQSYNVYEEAVSGRSVDDDFSLATDTGPVWDGSKVARIVGGRARTIGDIKARMKAGTTAIFREKSVSGTTVDGVVFATTNDAVQELREAVAEVKDGSTLRVVTRSGSRVDFDTALATAVLTAIRAYRKACFVRERVLWDAIDAAADIAALRAIDPDRGWPA